MTNIRKKFLALLLAISMVLSTCVSALATDSQPSYVSIEVLKVKPINESDYRSIFENGNKEYVVPDFTYKITMSDGSSEVRKSTNTFSLLVDHEQYDNPWTVGGENKLRVSIFGADVSAEFSAIIEKSEDYQYVEKEDGIYITDCLLSDEEISVPAEIDGKPVVGIISMGFAMTKVKTLTLPDSVVTISPEAISDWISPLEKLYIGKNVNSLSVDMVLHSRRIKEIHVSAENPYFASVDGVVYNKNLDTVMLYPVAKANYTVPDFVKNIDVLNANIYSELDIAFNETCTSFKTVDSVTYTADMKKVVSCDPEKTGDYIMPSSVTEISQGAFRNSKLTSVMVSENVTEIPSEAFYYCSNLTNITLPENLISISDKAFADSNLGNLTSLPSSLTYIGKESFYRTSFNSINIPSGVKEISDHAFSGSLLTKVTIPEGVEIIGYRAFYYSKLESVNIPNSVKKMGGYAFSYAPLKSLKLGSGLTEIPEYAFYSTELTEVTLPKNIVSVGERAFAGTNISTLTFENDAVEIGEGAFAGTSIQNLVLPKDITRIGSRSFSGISTLRSVDIPDSIKSIGGYAFGDGVWYKNQPDGALYLKHILYSYKRGSFEPDQITVRDGTTIIADYAFEEPLINSPKSFTSIILPEGLITIGNFAFLNNTALTSIDIPESVEYIGYQAFAGCDSLTKINVDPNNKYYSSENGVLFNKDKTELIFCPKQESKSYTIPESVTLVRAGAFGNSGVDIIEIPNDNTTLEEHSLHSQYHDEEFSIQRVITIVCNKKSTAYEYALENLQDIIITPSLTITSLPKKLAYKEGEELDTTGLQLCFTDSNGDEEIITEGYLVTGFDSAITGEQTLTVSYGGKTTELTIKVIGVSSGDLNGDILIDVVDLAILKKMVAGLKESLCVDLNGDGNTDVVDLAILKKIVAGLE